MIEPRPLEAIAGFVAHLRDNGLAVGIAEHRSIVEAALVVPVDEAHRLRAGWRAIVCHDAADWRKYPDLHDGYWRPARRQARTRLSGTVRPRRDLRAMVADLHATLDAPPSGNRPPDASLGPSTGSGGGVDDPSAAERHRGGASRIEALVDRDVQTWLPQDLARLMSIVEAIARRMRRRLVRRYAAVRTGRRLDVGRTLRRSARTGGEPLEPVWRKPRRERPQLYLLVDVSRSMETYAQLFLRIARAFISVLDTRVFVFHTRLAEVTRLLARDSGVVQEKINAVTAGFGGGTRIATSIADFAGAHAGRALSRRSRVWILSDGFDSDPPDALAAALERIRRRGARIVWLHPTRAVPASEAIARSAPLISRFAPVHDLESLARLRDLVEKEVP